MPFKRYVAATLALAITAGFVWSKSIPTNLDNHIDPRTVSDSFDPNDLVATFNGQRVHYPFRLLSLDQTGSSTPTRVLGDQTLDKRIEVDLTSQTLTAFEGGAAVYTFPVSTGLWGKTPTGTFHVWGKFRATKMEGGSKERHTYYYLPNVPYVLFFQNDDVPGARGFSIHGAYWHNNFGHPMSHGCVNMKPEEAKIIYDWATPELPEGKRSTLATPDNPGTEIIIYGEAPKS